MRRLRLSIDTADWRLGFDLMGNPQSLGSGATVVLPGNATLTYRHTEARRAFGMPETVELLLAVTTGTASGLAANWLYEKLKGRKVTLRIEEQEVQIDEGEIKRVISRIIERSE
jgi:hypothetical protein